MRQAIHIFRKDVSRHWPVIAALLGTWAVSVWLDQPGRELVQGITILRILVPLASCLLVAAVIQEECLCDDRAFWLSRPYDRRSLLAAKALFILAFVNLPYFVSDVVRLASQDLTVTGHLSRLLSRQAAITCWLILGPAALSAVSRNLRQFGMIFAAAVAGAATISSALPSGLFVSWGRLGWFRATLQFAIFGAVSLAVLLLQYARRSTSTGRAFLGAGFALTFAMPLLLPWSTSFAVQARLAGPPSSGIRVERDPARSPGAVQSSSARTMDLRIPVRTAGLPPGHRLFSDVVAVEIGGPGLTPWRSGWRADMALSEDGESSWVTVKIDRTAYASLKDGTADLRLAMALTVFADSRRTVVFPRSESVRLPGGEVCTIRDWYPRQPVVDCVFLRSPARTLMHVEHPTLGSSPRSQIIWPGSYHIDPGDIEIVPWTASRAPLPAWRASADAAVVFTTQRPVAHIQRWLTVSRIRLADYF